MEFTGTYYQCVECDDIWDYSDSHCPNCGAQNETEISVREIKTVSNNLIIKGYRLIEMLKNHGDQ